MLKVIIADDEQKVCKLIHHLVDWESMGLEVAAIINDGENALKAIKEIRPDIVITDIRMPGYDGIELIRRVKEILPEVYFIIISGYSHFEYAQKAIKYGVENYLLKPIKKKELIDTLAKIIEKHNLVQIDDTRQKELKKIVYSSKEKAKKNFLAEILFNPASFSHGFDFELINKEYYSHFQDGFFVIAIIRPFLELGEDNEEMKALLLTKIQSLVNEKLESICLELITIIWEEQIVCLINTDDPKLSSIKKQFNKIKIDIANLKDIFQKANVVIGIGEVTDTLSYIYSNIEKAETAVRYRFCRQGAYIIEYKESSTTSSKIENSNLMDLSMKSRFLSYFETLAIDKVIDELSDIKLAFKKNANNSQLIFDWYNELIDIILYGARSQLDMINTYDTTWFRKQFDKFYTLDDMFSWLKNWITEEFERYKDIKKNRDAKPIRIAKQYINENFNKAISLEEISSMIGFNPAYFSSMFKKETGENFIDYVMNTRIQNAKSYLLQTDMKVDEVALAVGYSDVKYFTRLFKKKTGLSPREFRKLYG